MYDRRLSARLARGICLLAAYPKWKINASSDSGDGDVADFCRLVDEPPELDVPVPNVLAPHRGRTIQRIRGQRMVLALEHGTNLNFAGRPGGDGLELIRGNRATSSTTVLHVHATLAVTETGLPLGLLRLGFDPQKVRPAKQRKTRRRTERRLERLDDIVEAVREVGGKTRVISVCDREGDIFELFDAHRSRPHFELLARAKQDKALRNDGQMLFATLADGRPDGMVEIEALTARPKTGGPAESGRLATCELRFRRVPLPATEILPGADPITVYGVHVNETAPPEGVEPVQWRLLTTVRVVDAAGAVDIVGLYLQRRRVVDFLHVLKAGCRSEFLRFRTADRLQRSIAFNAVIAWRIMVMTLLGREVPDSDPQLMFTDRELGFLRDYAIDYGLKSPERLGDAVRLVAHLGGYRDRKHDPEPGNQIMWHGQTRLTSAALGHGIGFRAGQRHAQRERE